MSTEHQPRTETHEADRDPARVTRLIETLKSQGVTMARVSHSDLYGKCRSKELPIEELGLATEGLGYCLISLIEDMNGNPLDLPGFAGDSHFPDFQAVDDLATRSVRGYELVVGVSLAGSHHRRDIALAAVEGRITVAS